jgi:hypothetical protein
MQTHFCLSLGGELLPQSKSKLMQASKLLSVVMLNGRMVRYIIAQSKHT